MCPNFTSEEPAPYGNRYCDVSGDYRWQYVDIDGYWSTACGHAFVFCNSDDKRSLTMEASNGR